jgi:hypothetical protein
MDDGPIPVCLPPPPNAGLKLRPPPVPSSLQVRLPPASLPVGRGNLIAISPQKRDRTKYPLGHFAIKRSKVHGGTKTAGTTSRRDSEEEMLVNLEGEGLSYSEYLESIQCGTIGFFKLHGDIYVVQGWDGKRKAAKVSVTSNLPSLDVLTGDTEQMVPLTLCQHG